MHNVRSAETKQAVTAKPTEETIGLRPATQYVRAPTPCEVTRMRWRAQEQAESDHKDDAAHVECYRQAGPRA